MRETIELQPSCVLYTPDARINLISCTQLNDCGISTLIERGSCSFVEWKAEGNIIGHAYGRQEDNVLLISGKVMKKEKISFCTTKLDHQEIRESAGISLWHGRLGHISKDMVTQMAKGSVKGMNIKAKAEIIECYTCVEAKQTKAPWDLTVAKGIFDHALRSDVIGPVTPRSWCVHVIL